MSFDPTAKEQFAKVVGEYGLTVPQAFKLFANQVIKTGVIPLSFDWAKNDKIPTDKLLNAISELEQGDVLTYDSLDDFVKAYDTTSKS
ncbi:hypothetical protein MOVS_09045 [Moraxella ovis]|nr:hypothetical protein MOVS_09045 [Moraxella ovis]